MIKIKKDMITMSKLEWEKLKKKLIVEHGQSILISYVCRRKLGFTVRESYTDTYPWREEINLDFFNEAQQTYFQLRFL